MKTRTLIIIGIIVIIISSGIVYAISIINEPKTAKECRFKYGKGGSELLDCLDKIKDNISTQKPSKVGPLNLYYQQCADLFNQIYEEFASRPSCERPTGATCEPELFETVIRNHEEFNGLNCGFELENWTYLSKYNDEAWGSLGPRFEIVLQNYYQQDESINLSLSKWGYQMCDRFTTKIINRADKSVVWENDSVNSCIVIEPSKWQEFIYSITTPSNPLILSEVGEYRVFVYLGDEDHDPIAEGYFGVSSRK